MRASYLENEKSFLKNLKSTIHNLQSFSIRTKNVKNLKKVAFPFNSVESINPRIMVATFNGNPSTTVISCYSPTNSSDEQDAADFYSDLTELTKAIPKHNVILVGGDMNAKINQIDPKDLFMILQTEMDST